MATATPQSEPTLIGVVRPNGATIVGHKVETQSDGSVVSTIVERTPEGALQHEITMTPAPDAPAATRAELVARVAAALIDNASFLAHGGNLEAQVEALTRQQDAVIRLLLDRLDTTTGA